MATSQRTKVLLPVVKRMILQLDELFVDFVGPIGQELSADIFAAWIAEGKVGPSAIRHYVQSLAEQLDNPSERQQFVEQAEHLLLQLQLGSGL